MHLWWTQNENSCTLTSAHKVTKNVEIFRLLQFSSCKSLKDKKNPLLAELKEELLQGGRVKQKLGFIKQIDKVRLPLWKI